MRLAIPHLENINYRVYYYDKNDGSFIFDEFVDWKKVKDGRYNLRDFVPPANKAAAGGDGGNNAPVDPARVVKESNAVVENFK